MTTQNTWLNCMSSLKNKHKFIAELLDGKSVAYVDIPIHFNVGDLLIYKGTEAFFTDYNINVVYRAGTKVDFKRLQQADVIILHGGGNFGDLYPLHQKLREEIVSMMQNKKIICMPQSIHFESDAALEQSASLFIKHPDFHFFVRDTASLEIANKFTKNAFLMPDMAHSLHPLVDQREVGKSNIMPPKILNLIRVDKESDGKNESVNKLGFDWLNIITTSDSFIQKLYYKITKVPFLRNRGIDIWSSLCDDIVFRSINHFSSHTIIHTDRLHGLILSSLLGKEVYLKDNSYGKNTKYYKAWLTEYPYLEVSDEV